MHFCVDCNTKKTFQTEHCTSLYVYLVLVLILVLVLVYKVLVNNTGWQLHWLYLCFVVAWSFDFIWLLFI